jgi:hypothetical protein
MLVIEEGKRKGERGKEKAHTYRCCCEEVGGGGGYACLHGVLSSSKKLKLH